MKVLISQYIRTLKERNELDKLLPLLLLSMDIVPLYTPQTGTRQFGVDICAVGKDPKDGVNKLFLFVVKQKDLGRVDWDTTPQSIKQSFNEIHEVYVKNCIQSKYFSLPKKIILSTSGDLKEELNQNWKGYIDDHPKYEFEFWGADQLSIHIEHYMLNEYIFIDEDKNDLRKSLSLIKENDYDRDDFHRLLLRKLCLDSAGKKIKDLKKDELEKSLRTCYLATSILSNWAINDGNAKQALFASERCFLWAWHRINLEKKPSKFSSIFKIIFVNYTTICAQYFDKLQPYFYEPYAVSAYSSESPLINITIYEQIGILSTIGLNYFFAALRKDEEGVSFRCANTVADSLCSLIINNPASGSPRLDENAIEITLSSIFLLLMGRFEFLVEWHRELIARLDFTLKLGRGYPISTDNIDDLIELECNTSKHIQDKTSASSWMIPTLIGWCVILDKEEGYNVLSKGVNNFYKKINSQLWHPTSSLYKYLYFSQAKYSNGETEASISYPDDIAEYGSRMKILCGHERYDIIKDSIAFKYGVEILDFIAYRHFRTPVPPSFWYKMLKNK